MSNRAAQMDTINIHSCNGTPITVVVGIPKATPPLIKSEISSVTILGVYRVGK